MYSSSFPISSPAIVNSADFYRFPRTPHLAWLGSRPARDDKMLTAAERDVFLAGEVIVEEKLDGANVGFSVDAEGRLLAQNRGGYIGTGTHGQFAPLARWLGPRHQELIDGLGWNLILFGEWCFAKHSIRYDRLPDWFLAFDVFDRATGTFWSTARRDAFARGLGLATVPRLGRGRYGLRELEAMIGPSRVGSDPAEGIYVRREDETSLLDRAKVVRREFTEVIGDHWSGRTLVLNSLA